MGLQFQAIASVAPALRAELGLDHAQIGFLIGLFLLPGAAIALPGGLLGARFGDRRATVVGLAMLTVGGCITALADSYAAALGGRLIAGIGGVLLNVLMTKMVADWFAGREIVPAMSILISTWPIGIAVALFGLAPLAELVSWRPALGLAAVLGGAGFLLVLLLYVEAPATAPPPAGLGLRALSGRELTLVLAAAASWLLFNAAYIVIVGFLPTWLMQSGYSMAGAGGMTSLYVLLSIVSVQAGGLLAQRVNAPNAVVVTGLLGWATVMALLPVLPLPVLLIGLSGLIAGWPAGVLVSLPAQVLRPASRAPGNGIFYTAYYVSNAVYPPMVGQLIDASGEPVVAVWATIATVLACLASFGLFRLIERRYLLIRT
jgi:predicted MFS family arabinose efflux permease